jgi:hypothetical protein
MSFTRKALSATLFLANTVVFAASDDVPPNALKQAKEYFKNHKKEFQNQKYISIIDYSKPSSAKRYYLIDLKTNETQKLLVAHGKGSDTEHTGFAKKFSDEIGSKQTSLGFFKTDKVYNGIHGESLKLIGLSPTNKNALKRAIVIHGANYVSENRKILGRSWGCPAVSTNEIAPLIEKIKEGSLLFAWHP